MRKQSVTFWTTFTLTSFQFSLICLATQILMVVQSLLTVWHSPTQQKTYFYHHLHLILEVIISHPNHTFYSTILCNFSNHLCVNLAYCSYSSPWQYVIHLILLDSTFVLVWKSIFSSIIPWNHLFGILSDYSPVCKS